MKIIKLNEIAEKLENICPVCNAGANESCTEYDTLNDIGYELGDFIHIERYEIK